MISRSASRARGLLRGRVRAIAGARRFEAAIVDWETGVAADPGADLVWLGRLLERLSGLGFDAGIVSAAPADEVDERLGARPRGPGSLYLCVRSGAELFDLTAEGPAPVPPWGGAAFAPSGTDGDTTRAAKRLLGELARRGVDREAVAVCGEALGPSDLGGDTVAVRAFLEDQLRRRLEGELAPFALDPAWSISFAGVDPLLERAHEALLTIANGRIGTNGAPLLAHRAAVPRVLSSGVYEGAGAESRLLEQPVWSRIDGTLGPADRLVRTLDLRRGLLLESVRRQDGRLDAIRFAPLSRAGGAVLRLAASRRVPRRRPRLLRPPAAGRRWASCRRDGVACLETRTETREVAAAAVEGPRGRGRTVDRFASYASGEEAAAESARSDALALRDEGFEALLCEQRSVWGERWQAADVVVDGDDELQLAVRLALFHLRSAAASCGETGIGARGLTGPGYRGHVFWDTDVFVLPALAATQPAEARSVLEYRIRRLEAARAEARARGRAGARFPWESAASGRDVTPQEAPLRTGEVVQIRTGELEEHVVADVAWAAAHYAQWTGDEPFAAGPGRTLLTETARYWASRIRLDPHGRGHIAGVIGPDEYHENVDDNAFTNVMARWNLRAAAAAAAGDGAERGDAARWLELAESLVDGYDPRTGIYEQFAGFSALEPLVIAELAPRRPVAADALLGRARVQGAQVVKQADVLMLHHLVPEEVAPGSLEPNLRFYEPRTAHGSSLSPAIYAGLLARAGMVEQALESLRLTARIDRDDLTQTTAGGLHLAAMGGLWQAFVFGFAGLRPRGSGLVLDPRLPERWRSLEVRVIFRGSRVSARIGHEELTLAAERPLTVRVGGKLTPVVATPEGVHLSRADGDWRVAR